MRKWLGMLRSAWTRNRSQMLLAVFLGMVCWYLIRAATSFEVEIKDVPISVRLDAGWAAQDQSAQTANVVLRGPRENLRFLGRESIRISVDARGKIVSTRVNVTLDDSNVIVPRGVRVVHIQPRELRLQVDQEDKRQVPVKVEFQSNLPEGFEVEKVVCSPDKITLSGPRRYLRDVEVIRTAPIDLDGRIRSFRRSALTLVAPSETWSAVLEPTTVVVDVFIVERAATHEFGGLPVLALVRPGGPRRIELGGAKVKALLRGHSEALKSMDPALLRAYVDCSDIDAPGRHDLPVGVMTPPGINVTGVEPPVVSVTVRE